MGRGAAFHLSVPTYAQRLKWGRREKSQSPRQCRRRWDIRGPAVGSRAAGRRR